MELSLISFPPSPSLICASAYLDGDGGARRGGDSSPLIDCKVWESLEVQLFQRKTPSDQHGSIADRVAALGSASFTPPSTRSVRAPHRGTPHPHTLHRHPLLPAVRHGTPADSDKYLQKRVTTLWEKVAFSSSPVGFVPH